MKTTTLKINPNLIFLRNNFPKKRLLVLEGGTRSGKTYSALQYIVWLAMRFAGAGINITIARRYKTDVMQTTYQDFKKILNGLGQTIRGSEWTYGRNTVRFVGASEAAKLHGLQQDILYCNEVLEFQKEEYDQLALRTKYRIICDYNPSYYTHWFYDYILKEESVATCHSTYKDNPHLSRSQIAEIESYKDKDPEVWRIYGMGLRRERAGIIYRNWQIGDYNWDMLDYPVVYGLDFGYTAPSALCGVKIADGVLYVREILYRSYLSTSELAELVRRAAGGEIVACDSAEPRTILELQRAGVNAVPVKKQANIIDSIRLVQTYRIFVTRDSQNLIRELENYAFSVDPNGQIIETPVRVNDHALDAMRYAVMKYNQLTYAVY